jgi:hypothetical protein
LIQLFFNNYQPQREFSSAQKKKRSRDYTAFRKNLCPLAPLEDDLPPLPPLPELLAFPCFECFDDLLLWGFPLLLLLLSGLDSDSVLSSFVGRESGLCLVGFDLSGDDGDVGDEGEGSPIANGQTSEGGAVVDV